jgi:hypothetical protein
MSFANATDPMTPNDQDITLLWLDRTNFVGTILGGVAYGERLSVIALWLCD